MTRVLIDTSWLAHKARYSMGALSFKKEPTGVMFGFFEQLRTICLDRRVNSNQVHLFFDSRQSIRKKEFPAYKASRDARKGDELESFLEMKRQLVFLYKEVLPEIGFCVYRERGFEADDLMASVASQTREDRSVIVTADADLYQCITDNVHYFNPTLNLYLDVADFTHKKRVGPNDWALVKAIAGCVSDEIPGVAGVGEKSAVDYIWKMLNPAHKRFQAIECPEGKRIIARNLRLVTLPHRKLKAVNILTPSYDTKAFFKWAKKLGFNSYLSNSRKFLWDRFFEGNTSDRQVIRKRGA